VCVCVCVCVWCVCVCVCVRERVRTQDRVGHAGHVHKANTSNKSFENEEKFTYFVMTVTNQNYLKK